MDHLIAPLKALGLTDKEARVYLALLQLGPATPYKIAKKSRLKRPTAYVIAEELVEKGLIVTIPGEETKRYIARSPETFFEGLEQKLVDARKILPELKSLQKGTLEKPSVLYFDGVEGVHQAHAYRQKELHDSEIVGFVASAEDASPELMAEFFDRNEYAIRHRIKLRALTVDSSTLAPLKHFMGAEKGIIIKYLPESIYSAKVSIESCKDTFVRIILFESMQSLIIESPKLAKTIREVFEITWTGLAGKYDTPKNLKV